MKTLSLQCPADEMELCKINKLISKSKKIITLTGAGISCNAGIPDFRSTEGLYNMVKRKHPDCVVKGKDLFDISLFRDEKTLKVFCTFMESLYSHTVLAKPTKTHELIKKLNERKKLIKCYTQNIDGLERHLDLNTGIGNWKSMDVIQLHGDLNKLNCTNCFQVFEWSEEFREQYANGEVPDCPNCTENFFNRINNGKRLSSSTVGFLKPNIILYGENHPYAENIAKGLQQDINKNPQLLIIFGTSLKVDGVKKLVRDLAKKVHQRDGLVIFVNKNPVGNSTWDKVIDYHIETDCDQWCEYLQQKIPDLFTELIITPPTTPSKTRVITSPLSDTKAPAKPNFNIHSDYPTPEYSPTKRTPRKCAISEKTLKDMTNITKNKEIKSPEYSPIKGQEELSPLYTPLRKIQRSPSLKRTRSALLPMGLSNDAVEITSVKRCKRKCTLN